MKKHLITALFASVSLLSQAQTLSFALEPTYAPFETINEKGELVGFDIDLANALCAELKATCEFKPQAFDSLIAGLKFNRFDAVISGMDITEARLKQVAFSQPYLENSASFLAIKGKTDLASAKNVGVQNGSTFQQYLHKNAKQYAIKPYASLQTAMLDLKNGRIDMIFGDTPVLAEWLKMEKDLSFVGEKVTDPTYFGNGYGIAVNQKNTALVEKLNAALNAIKNKGQYQQIYHTWLAGQ